MKRTEMILRSMSIDTWIKQNKGEIIDIIEGCLLDTYLIECKRGYAIAREHYLNNCSSTHKITWQAGSAPDIWEIWDDLTANAEIA